MLELELERESRIVPFLCRLRCGLYRWWRVDHHDQRWMLALSKNGQSA